MRGSISYKQPSTKRGEAQGRVRKELVAAGMQPIGAWTDPAGDYLVTLA